MELFGSIERAVRPREQEAIRPIAEQVAIHQGRTARACRRQ